MAIANTKTLMQRIQAVQDDVVFVKKDMRNTHFQSKYADINSYIEMLRPLFKLHAIVVLQPFVQLDNGTTGVKTVITCDTGETFESFMPVPLSDNPQKVGSFITYSRRYSIQSLFFLGAEDDDGEAAVRPTNSGFGGAAAPATKTWNKGGAK